MITYNHEKYIAEAIEGVLMQEVDFEVELIIADDASTDHTGEIIQSYIDSHPRGFWIKYTRHVVNKGMMGNFVWALEQCKGEYIALCEGDDYWDDRNKIKIQVAFLSENKHYSGCFHNVQILDGCDLKDDFITKNKVKKDVSSFWDVLLFGNFIHTCSFVYRKSSIINIPEYFSDLKVGDFFLFLECAKGGPIKMLDFMGGVYRYGVGSFSSESIQKIRTKFKKSLLVVSRNQRKGISRIILFLRVHQDNLYNSRRGNLKDEPNVTFFDLLSALSFIQISKAIIKAILRIETSKL
ncbi:glycosyltransferase [Algoriphagus litoralis]|uniref:glycosyltransferase n=1 Tax=Algoriphagus litoralis TaxID=2202829 RepID=UPI00130058C0|nr:glycosyltransferase [Algoriphagus litoralis]